MLLFTKKKKNIFSKRSDVIKHTLNTTPEYVKRIEIFDEDVAVSKALKDPVVNHELIIRIPIDKLSAIKNNVKFIEGYFCSDVTFLRARSKTFAGFGKRNIKHLNYAIHNKEKLARKSFRSRERKAKLQKAFSVDINSTMLVDVKVQDVLDGRKSLSEIFGYEEYFIVSRNIIQQRAQKNKRSDLNHLSSNTRSTKEISSFGNFEIEKRKNNEAIMTRRSFQRKYASMHKAGIDPAVSLSRSAYKSQSLQQMTQGTIPKDFQTDRASEKRFGEDFHKMIDSEISVSKISSSIVRRKRSKEHESLEVKILVTDRIIKSMGGSNKIDVVVFAKDKNLRKIDYHIVSIDISKLEIRKRKETACENLNNYEIMCNRSSNDREVIKGVNQSNQNITCNIIQAKINSHSRISEFNFRNYLNAAIPSKTNKYLVNPSSSRLIGKTQGYFYRSKPSFPDVSFDNTKFYNIPPISKINEGTSISLHAENNVYPTAPSSVTIFLDNLPEEALGCNVVKRNLSKSEKDFKIIKNLRQITSKEGKVSLLDLDDHLSSFFKSSDIDESFSFVDEDVEQGDTYEYKALIYGKNGSPELSLNSFEITHESRTDIVNIRIKSSSHNSVGKFTNSKRLIYEFIVDIKEDSIDKLFSGLDRNTYELFSEDLSKIRESIKKNVSCIAKVVNTLTGEVIEVGRFVVDSKNKTFKVEFFIKDIFSKHVLIVEPRVASISYVVDNLLEKMETLPAIQSMLPISTFSRNLKVIKRKRRVMNPGSKMLSSVSVGKYASRSVRFFSLILDPVTRFNIERDDVYYEGNTGDVRVFEVYNPKDSNTLTPLRMTGLADLTSMVDKNTQRYSKKSILYMRCDEDESFVDFYAFYTKSAGTVTFHGMISPDGFRLGKDYYNFYLDLSDELGIVEVFYVCVLKNGTFSKVTNLSNLVCSHNSVRKLR